MADPRSPVSINFSTEALTDTDYSDPIQSARYNGSGSSELTWEEIRSFSYNKEKRLPEHTGNEEQEFETQVFGGSRFTEDPPGNHNVAHPKESDLASQTPQSISQHSYHEQSQTLNRPSLARAKSLRARGRDKSQRKVPLKKNINLNCPPCPYGATNWDEHSKCAPGKHTFRDFARLKEHISRTHKKKVPRTCTTWEAIFSHCLPNWGHKDIPFAGREWDFQISRSNRSSVGASTIARNGSEKYVLPNSLATDNNSRSTPTEKVDRYSMRREWPSQESLVGSTPQMSDSTPFDTSVLSAQSISSFGPAFSPQYIPYWESFCDSSYQADPDIDVYRLQPDENQSLRFIDPCKLMRETPQSDFSSGMGIRSSLSLTGADGASVAPQSRDCQSLSGFFGSDRSRIEGNGPQTFANRVAQMEARKASRIRAAEIDCSTIRANRLNQDGPKRVQLQPSIDFGPALDSSGEPNSTRDRVVHPKSSGNSVDSKPDPIFSQRASRDSLSRNMDPSHLESPPSLPATSNNKDSKKYEVVFAREPAIASGLESHAPKTLSFDSLDDFSRQFDEFMKKHFNWKKKSSWDEWQLENRKRRAIIRNAKDVRSELNYMLLSADDTRFAFSITKRS